MISVLELTGQTVGSYVLRSLIGEGGMGAVYLAEHQSLGRKAALKVLKRELATDQVVVARFQEEARAASNVIHPNIVHIYDIGTLPDGLPFIVMELLEGESLGRRLGRGPPLTVDEALGIAAQAASALQAVHARGIVHRDLKPDNLFLTPDPVVRSGLRVKVLDFGVAKLRGDLSGGGVKTREGVLLGTPLYMSPEQCRGLVAEVDQRSDVYALGLILYEMLSGAPPFNAATFGDLIVQHVSRPPPPLSAALGVPAQVEAAVMTALAKAPADRFASMTDFRLALARGSTQKLPVTGARAPEGPWSTHDPAPTVRANPSPAPRATRLYDSIARPQTTTLSSAATDTTVVTFSRGRGRWILTGLGLLVAAGLLLAWWRAAQRPDARVAPASSAVTRGAPPPPVRPRPPPESPPPPSIAPPPLEPLPRSEPTPQLGSQPGSLPRDPAVPVKTRPRRPAVTTQKPDAGAKAKLEYW
jgi:serine/threonine protein kinase